MKNERILVTGGTGFIGTHLVNRLVNYGFGECIEIVDDLSSSSITPARLEFFRQNGAIFRKMSVQRFQTPTDIHYRQIYHLACRVGPAHVLKYAGRMVAEIVNDAMKMAELALRNDAPLISIGTSEVYGSDPGGVPQREDIPLVVPAHFSPRLEYTIGKLAAEIQLMNLAATVPLRVNVVRLFNIVGPGQLGNGGFVIPRFVDSALRGEPITVFGDGTQVRSFTHVADLIDALLLIMKSDVNRRIYNVGTTENTCSIGHLARRVVAMTNSRSETHCVNPKNIFGEAYTDAPSKIPDISRIKSELGWQPTWSLDEIIADCIRSAKGEVETPIMAVA